MGFNMKVTPEIEALTKICQDNSKMDVSLYGKYDVKRGLRDINGKGVLAGLTQVSNIVSSKIVDGKSVPCDGELYYRGINIEDLTNSFLMWLGIEYNGPQYLLWEYWQQFLNIQYRKNLHHGEGLSGRWRVLSVPLL